MRGMVGNGNPKVIASGLVPVVIVACGDHRGGGKKVSYCIEELISIDDNQ